MATKDDPLSAAERAAVRERTREVARQRRAKDARAAGLADVVARIAAMPEPDRVIAQRVHELVLGVKPDVEPRTWYGMPAYAVDGKVVCFFQAASQFGVRYATLGFNESAALDEGSMWPVTFAVTRMTRVNETRIRALLRAAFDAGR